MEAVAYATIPTNTEIIDAPKSNANIAELEATRVLFFAHDTISDREKREAPFKKFGGIHLPQVPALRQLKGMLYRCQFTLFPKYTMVGDNKEMLGPFASRDHEDSFVRTVIENGEAKEQVVRGFLGSDANPELKENGEFRNRRSDHIVYRRRYAAQDAALAKRRTPFGNAPGGVTEITALKGSTKAEVDEAQLFFFPAWHDIIAGRAELPNDTAKDFQAYVNGRKALINNMPWDVEKKNKYHSIVEDMLTSSTEYTRHAVDMVRSDEIVVKDATTRGAAGIVRHSPITEKYLEQTSTRRKEDVLTGQVNDVATLTAEMRADRQASVEVEAKKLLLEERKQYVIETQAGYRERDEAEEIRLGMKKGVIDPPIQVPTDFATTANVEVYEQNVNLQDYVVGTNSFAVPVAETTETLPESPEPHAQTASIDETEAPVDAEVVEYSIGDTLVLSDGTEATVIAKPFGRAKVRLADGREMMLDKL